LIKRRKIYPAELRDALMRAMTFRQTADYEEDLLTETQMARNLRHAQTFVGVILRARQGIT